MKDLTGFDYVHVKGNVWVDGHDSPIGTIVEGGAWNKTAVAARSSFSYNTSTDPHRSMTLSKGTWIITGSVPINPNASGTGCMGAKIWRVSNSTSWGETRAYHPTGAAWDVLNVTALVEITAETEDFWLIAASHLASTVQSSDIANHFKAIRVR